MSYSPLTRAALAAFLAGSAACARMARMESPYLSQVTTADPAAGQVDHAMKSFAAQGFSGTVLIAEGSRVILYKGYGRANRARELPNSAETRYPLGAVENVFTAAAMLRLEEEGKISTQDLVSRFVPAPGDLRIDDLLRRNREVTAVAYAGGMASMTGPADPLAERFAETGASYVTLRKVIEQVTGESYENYVTNHLLIPHGLTRTFWDNGAVGDSLVARGYQEPLGETVIAKGMVAPLADLYQFRLALRDNKVVSPDSKRRMFAPAPNGYGYGWVVSTTPGGARVTEHAGDQVGFQTWIAYYPDQDVLILLGVNNDGGWRRPISVRLTEIMVDSASAKGAVVSSQ